MKRIVIALALIAAIFALGFILYNPFAGERSHADRAIDAAAPLAQSPQVSDARALEVDATVQRIRVTAATGTVERRVADGTWSPVSVGDELSLRDEVRTTPGATVVIELGDRATVDVAEQTSVTLAELSETLSRVTLQEGRISAKVHESDSARLRVEVSGSDAVAETDEGQFSVLSSGTGQVAVASQEGAVDVSSEGETVRVGAGEQSIVRADLPPSPPEKIPGSFFLKVGGPGKTVQRKKQTTIRGTTTPGAVVSINGVRGEVDENGVFSTKVTLREGRNRITVVVEDVSGRRKQQSVPVVVDTRAPDVKSEVDWNK